MLEHFSRCVHLRHLHSVHYPELAITKIYLQQYSNSKFFLESYWSEQQIFNKTLNLIYPLIPITTISLNFFRVIVWASFYKFLNKFENFENLTI